MNRLELASKSLLGTSIGDAFGDGFFCKENFIKEAFSKRKIPRTASWDFTDDTVMSIAIYKSLEKFGEVNQDFIANEFADNYHNDFRRGYGPSMHRKLKEIHQGGSWKQISKNAFGGMGSMGNGGAMRSALIGAYFYDDLKKVGEQAYLSSEITHANIEGYTGAMAVAIASAIATNNIIMKPNEFLSKIINELPDCDTTSKINKATSVSYSYDIRTVISILGNGVKITAQDTVPIALWAAAHNLYNFGESIWKAVSALGDRDTICAIVGGIVMMSADESTIPVIWKQNVESWEKSIFYKK